MAGVDGGEGAMNGTVTTKQSAGEPVFYLGTH